MPGSIAEAQLVIGTELAAQRVEMNPSRLASIAVLCALAVVCTSSAYALTLAGHISPTTAIADALLPDHPGYFCRTTAYDAQLLSYGTHPGFQTAFFTPLIQEWDPTGWTLDWAAAPLNATLNITTYEAFNYGPEYDSSYAGAEINVEWTPTADQQDLLWIQAINTNLGRHGEIEWYLDVYTFTKDRPPVYPFQYADHHFYDMPMRWCVPGEHVFWDAYTYLASVDRANKHVTAYEGLYWGFSVDYVPAPEPAGWAVLACAAIGLIGRMRLRQNSR